MRGGRGESMSIPMSICWRRSYRRRESTIHASAFEAQFCALLEAILRSILPYPILTSATYSPPPPAQASTTTTVPVYSKVQSNDHISYIFSSDICHFLGHPHLEPKKQPKPKAFSLKSREPPFGVVEPSLLTSTSTSAIVSVSEFLHNPLTASLRLPLKREEIEEPVSVLQSLYRGRSPSTKGFVHFRSYQHSIPCCGRSHRTPVQD